jgi:hypothetical protein
MQAFHEIPPCPVCMEELTSNLVTTGCGHVFHFEW